jgi:exodeoxyribonuclease VIII
VSLAELAPGLHANVPAAEYHRRILGLASNAALKRVAHAPALYRAWVACETDDEETPALAFGRALHCSVFEPDEFARLFVVEPVFGDCRKTANRDARDAWRSEHKGKGWLSADDGAAIDGMAAALRAHPKAGPLLRARGQSEITCRWDDPETGLPCKARGDRWAPELRTLADLKSTEDARAAAFRRSCEMYGYDQQEALYRAGWKIVGEPVDDFAFIAVEKQRPHLVKVYTLAASSVSEADWENRKALRTLADCLQNDEWPGLDPAIEELELRPWRLAK